MSELKFSGTATLTGFPLEKSFNFELDGPDRLIVKAGKEIFLVIEKEAAPAVVADVVTAAESTIVAPTVFEGPTVAPTPQLEGSVVQEEPTGDRKSTRLNSSHTE